VTASLLLHYGEAFGADKIGVPESNIATSQGSPGVEHV
jgi:hypothetical protein